MLKYDFTNRSTELEQERVIKKFKIKYQSSPREKTTRKEATHSKKPLRLVFEAELTVASSDEVSQKNLLSVDGGEIFPDRDITDYEWAIQYIDSSKRVVMLAARNKGHDQLAKDRPFSYGRLLHLDYEDPDSNMLILLVDCSRGFERCMFGKISWSKSRVGLNPSSLQLKLLTI